MGKGMRGKEQRGQGKREYIAQLVEQITFNEKVEGSNPSVLKWRERHM